MKKVLITQLCAIICLIVSAQSDSTFKRSNWGIKSMTGAELSRIDYKLSSSYLIALTYDFHLNRKWSLGTEVRYGVKSYNSIFNDTRVSFSLYQQANSIELPIFINRCFYVKERLSFIIGAGIGISATSGNNTATVISSTKQNYTIDKGPYPTVDNSNSRFLAMNIKKSISYSSKLKGYIGIEYNHEFWGPKYRIETFNYVDYNNPDPKISNYTLNKRVVYLLLSIRF